MDGFLVRLVYPIGGDWEETDAAVYRAAGRRSDRGGTVNGCREHEWRETSFDGARALKARLRDSLSTARVTMREE